MGSQHQRLRSVVPLGLEHGVGQVKPRLDILSAVWQLATRCLIPRWWIFRLNVSDEDIAAVGTAPHERLWSWQLGTHSCLFLPQIFRRPWIDFHQTLLDDAVCSEIDCFMGKCPLKQLKGDKPLLSPICRPIDSISHTIPNAREVGKSEEHVTLWLG